MVLRLPNNIVIVSKTYPSFLTVKEGSTFLTKPLFPQEREDVTALRCSEPLRYKVGGPIKGLRQIVRDGTARGNYYLKFTLNPSNHCHQPQSHQCGYL